MTENSNAEAVKARRRSRSPAPVDVNAINQLAELALDDLASVNHLVGLAQRVRVSDASVRAAFVRALGNLGDPQFVDEIMRFADDRAVTVRAHVAAALPLATVRLDEPPEPVLRQLLAFAEDPSLQVRDWAAFALGTQMDVDSPDVRRVLRELLTLDDTADACPAAEAAVGLARRGDEDVVKVIQDRLTSDPNVGSLWLVAAGATGSPVLLPVLRTLQSIAESETDATSEEWRSELHAAIDLLSNPLD